MRVLVASTAGTGHFGPLVPFALALREAGHDVAVAAPTSFAEDVAAAGLAHHPFPDAPPELMGETFARLSGLSLEEADHVVVREVFGRLDTQAALPGVRATIERWSPDLVLREPCELSSLGVAEAAGVPHATVAIGMTRAICQVASDLTEPLAELDDLVGVSPGCCAAAFEATTVLTSVPPTLDDAVARGSPMTVHRFNVEQVGSEVTLPAAWGNPEWPLVPVSFGSVAARLEPFRSIYARVLEALADTPYRVLLTTGSGVDPAELGPLPTNTHVERWWPQASLMPAAAAMVGHGGFGTTMTAVAHGVPQVLLPLFSFDQRLNADHIVAAGAGVRVDGGPDGAEQVPAALASLLGDAGYRTAAEAVAKEVATLPPVTEALALLEDLSRPTG